MRKQTDESRGSRKSTHFIYSTAAHGKAAETRERGVSVSEPGHVRGRGPGSVTLLPRTNILTASPPCMKMQNARIHTFAIIKHVTNREERYTSLKGKVKRKLSLFFKKHHTMKTW